MMPLGLYLLSIPLAVVLTICVWVEDRREFTSYEGGWWDSFKFAVRWSDVLTGIVIGCIPVLNSIATVCMGLFICVVLWEYLVGDLLSRPVFSRKVVINLKKD